MDHEHEIKTAAMDTRDRGTAMINTDPAVVLDLTAPMDDEDTWQDADPKATFDLLQTRGRSSRL
eukprot:12163653-Alexandrium_andersonii.AAC.1